jgi:predicted ribosomally synthesized peptide with nif11-like leader
MAMSIESAKAFWSKVTEDNSFRQKLEALTDDKQRVELARSAGFDFTMDELKQVVSEKVTGGRAGGELTDEALESVWGGTTTNIVSITAGGILHPKPKP